MNHGPWLHVFALPKSYFLILWILLSYTLDIRLSLNSLFRIFCLQQALPPPQKGFLKLYLLKSTLNCFTPSRTSYWDLFPHTRLSHSQPLLPTISCPSFGRWKTRTMCKGMVWTHHLELVKMWLLFWVQASSTRKELNQTQRVYRHFPTHFWQWKYDRFSF